MKRKLHVLALMDEAWIPSGDPQLQGSPDDPTAEYHVTQALRELGHEVSILGTGVDVDALVAAVRDKKPDMVFNITEVFLGSRLMDKNVAALLEMLEVPFTGSGVAGLMLARDKGLSKQLLSHHRIRVPGFTSLHVGKTIRVPKAMRYPMVVKPAYEDGSEGISNASLVRDENALRERVAQVHERWQQPAVIEEYIDGRELYVAVLGNHRLSVLPAREVFFENGDEGPVLATYKVKWDEAYRKRWNVNFSFAELDDELFTKVARVCKKAFRVMQLRDYGRIDLRVMADGRIVILEVNPNPDLAYGEEVSESAEKAGISYNELIDRVLRSAWRRYHG